MIIIGCKGKYSEWISPDGLIRIEGLARDGLTDIMLAQKIGISETTFYEWQNRFPEFAEAIKKGKAPVDNQVESALLKKALGYEYEETVTEIYEEDGVKRKHVRKMLKHSPPDTGAIAFWLKNRRPGKWRDKIEAAPETANELLQSLFDLERRVARD